MIVVRNGLKSPKAINRLKVEQPLERVQESNKHGISLLQIPCLGVT